MYREIDRITSLEKTIQVKEDLIQTYREEVEILRNWYEEEKKKTDYLKWLLRKNGIDYE